MFCTSGQISTGNHARPNIIIFLSDDHGVEDAGCYGNQDLKTPVIDRLAEEGMRFTRAYTPVSVCAPSRSALFTGLYPHRNGCDRNHGHIRDGVKSLPDYFSAAGYEVVLAGKVHVKPEKAFPFIYKERHDVPAYLRNAGSKPFCLIVSMNAPHQPYFNMKGGYEKIHPKPWLPSTSETLQYTAAYYDHVTMADNEIGAMLYWLHKYDFEENTVQVYLSDHGPAFPFSKWTLYDQGIRIPLIIKWPGVIEPGTRCDALVSVVDILPTLAEIANIKSDLATDGKSLLPLLTQKTEALHEEVFAAYTNLGVGGGNEYPIRTIVEERFKLIVNLRWINMVALERMDEPDSRALIDARTVIDSWKRGDSHGRLRAEQYKRRPHLELYDLRDDPYELNNLADDATFDSVKRRLYAKLARWMMKQEDPRSVEMVSLK